MKDATEILERLSSAMREGRLLSGMLRRFSVPRGVAREHFYRWALGQTYRRCHTLPCISFHGNFSVLPSSVLLKRSLEQAVAGIGGPPAFVRAIDGMSGTKFRTFTSNFVRSYADAEYLEVGSWQPQPKRYFLERSVTDPEGTRLVPMKLSQFWEQPPNRLRRTLRTLDRHWA